MTKIVKLVRDNIIFSLVAFLPYVLEPAIVHAQQSSGQYSSFLQPLSLTRGSLSPGNYPSEVLSKEFYCDLMKNDWGWRSCDGFDTVIAGYNGVIDTLLIEKPYSEGFVRFDDWNSSDKDDEIKEIEKELKRSLKAQAEATKSTINFLGWQAYPTLDQKTKTLMYAVKVKWDGKEITNVKASKFDRRGYVVFRFVPMDSNLSQAALQKLVTDTIDNYSPKPRESYASFVTGDKVAAAGALGVLATLVGVKYGKAIGAGLLAIALAFLKKGGVILLLPLIWLGKFLTRLFGKG